MADVLLPFLINLIMLPAAWLVVRKAGFHGAWSLLTLMPGINAIALYVFAFAAWPVCERQRKAVPE